jgi:hypothetical protein
MDAPNLPAAPQSPHQRRRPLLAFLRRRWEGWRLRHQLPFNFYIHLVGIPLAVSSLPLLLLFPYQWYLALGAVVGGYLLQWVGHRAEGNDVGEWAAIKRMLGLPYVGISPRWKPEDPDRL